MEPLDSLPPDVLAALDGPLDADGRARLAAAVAADPALADALARWEAVRADVRRELDAAVPDRRLLVLAALDDGDLDDDERARLAAARPALDAALSRRPALAAALARTREDRAAFARVWEDGTAVERGTEAKAPVRMERAGDRPVRRAGAPAPVYRWIVRSAAVVAVVAFGAMLALIARRDAGFERVEAAVARTVALPDGSTAELAAGAVLMVPEEGEGPLRQARLVSGRALFDVAHTGAPFVVETPNAAVTVLGTTFAVTAAEAETDVALVSGVVTLEARGEPGGAVRLAPGESSRVRFDDAPTPPAPADLRRALAWTGDWSFRAEPLGDVVARLAATAGATITLDPSLAAEPVSGRYRRGSDVAPALRALALAVGAEVTERGGAFRIAPRPVPLAR